MKIVITGGTGFIGLWLARKLLTMGNAIDELVLFDVVMPDERPSGLDERVKIIAGDMADPDAIATLIDRPDIGVYHLASVVSGGAEQDFDLAMRINVHGHLHLLEALRRLGSKPRYVFASSIATFGGEAIHGTVSDSTKHTPRTTYGVTKAIGELLVNDYSRKGFIDGRSARLSGVIVRPGKPNKAATSFISAVIREPLSGVDYTLPVPLTTRMPVSGYRTVASDLIALYEADSAAIGDDRAVNLPNMSVSVDEMIMSLRRVAGDRKLGRIDVAPDPFVTKIIDSLPTCVDATRAKELGLSSDEALDSIIRAYISDYLDG